MRWTAALTIFLLVPVAVSETQDMAQFTYSGGSEVTGAIAGSCDDGQFELPSKRPTTLSLDLVQGELIRVERWVNATYVQPHPDAIPVQVSHSEERREHPISLYPGPLEIEFGPEARMRWRGDSDLFRFRIDASHLTTREVFEEYHGPTRYVESDQDAYELAAKVRFNIYEEARVKTADGSIHEVPPYHQTPSWTGPDKNVSYRTDVYTFGLFSGHVDTIRLQSNQVRLTCRHLELDVRGGGLFHDATGTLGQGTETIRFDHQELATAGEFSLSESVSEGSEARWGVSATAQGNFEALGVDYRNVPLPSLPPADLARVGLLALLIAAAATVASQFSRFIGIFYTRVGVDKALDNAVRSLIHDSAQQRPGLILKDMVATTGKSYGVIRHHARVLEHLGLVRTVRHGRAVHLFPADASKPKAARDMAWNRDGALRFLVSRVGVQGLPMAEALRAVQAQFGFSKMGAWKVVRRSQQFGWVERDERPEGVWLRTRE